MSAFKGFTTKKKIAAAVETNVMAAVMKAPYRKTASLIVNVSSLKSGLPMIIAMIGMIRSFDERVDERRECEAHHERNRQLDEVAAHEEVPELRDHVPAFLFVGSRRAG